MHKFRVLLELEKESIGLAEAAKLLNVEERVAKQLLTLWTGRLKHIVPLVDQLVKPVNNKADQAALKKALAEQLDTSYRQVNRLLAASGILVPMPIKSEKRVKKHVEAVKRIGSRKKHALDVIAGLSDAEHSAEAAGTTPRHIWRVCGHLLKPEGYVFRDLRRMDTAARKRLADKIEESLKEEADVTD